MSSKGRKKLCSLEDRLAPGVYKLSDGLKLAVKSDRNCFYCLDRVVDGERYWYAQCGHLFCRSCFAQGRLEKRCLCGESAERVEIVCIVVDDDSG